MKRTNANAALLSAAVSGILFGLPAAARASQPMGGGDTARAAGLEDPAAWPLGDVSDAGAKHACKGQNACKGQGGCKTDKNGCRGENACKGQGGCRTDGKK